MVPTQSTKAAENGSGERGEAHGTRSTASDGHGSGTSRNNLSGRDSQGSDGDSGQHHAPEQSERRAADNAGEWSAGSEASQQEDKSREATGAVPPDSPPTLEKAKLNPLLKDLSALDELGAATDESLSTLKEYRQDREIRAYWSTRWNSLAGDLHVLIPKVKQARYELHRARAGCEDVDLQKPVPEERARGLGPEVQRALFSRPPGVDDDRLVELDLHDAKWQTRLKKVLKRRMKAQSLLVRCADASHLAQVLRARVEEARQLVEGVRSATPGGLNCTDAEDRLEEAEAELAQRTDRLVACERRADVAVRKVARAARALSGTTKTYARFVADCKEAYDQSADPAAAQAYFASGARDTLYRTETAYDVLKRRTADLSVLFEQDVREMVADLSDMQPGDVRFHEGLGARIALLDRYISILDASLEPPSSAGSPLLREGSSPAGADVLSPGGAASSQNKAVPDLSAPLSHVTGTKPAEKAPFTRGPGVRTPSPAPLPPRANTQKDSGKKRPAPDSCTSSSGAEFVDTDLSPSSREVLSAMSTAGSSSKATHKTTKRTKTTT